MANKFKALITSGKRIKPLFGVVYGVEGVGKTSFGAQMPNPIFVGPETADQFNVARMPEPKDWKEFRDQLQDIIDSDYGFKSVVVDSLDWLERMLHEHMMKLEGKSNIKDTCGGYGNWVDGAVKHWETVFRQFAEIRKKGIHILLISHFDVKPFNDPLSMAPYDRYRMKLQEKSSAFIREAVDFVFFANFETYKNNKASTDKKEKRTGDGTRIMMTEKRPSHDAKNRFNLPEVIPFDFKTVYDLITNSDEDKLRDICKDIEDLIMDVTDGDKAKSMREYFEKNKNDYSALVAIKNKIKVAIDAQKEN